MDQAKNQQTKRSREGKTTRQRIRVKKKNKRDNLGINTLKLH
jgi:hypothetical protein